MDIAFAIHQNANQEEFSLMKYFVEQSLMRFEISDARSHASLLSYGRNSKVVFDFNDMQDFNRKLRTEIKLLEYNPGRASLIDLLAMACDRIFCKIGGTREDVSKVIFDIFTCFKRNNIILILFSNSKLFLIHFLLDAGRYHRTTHRIK